MIRPATPAFTRRPVLRLVVGAALLPLLPRAAWAATARVAATAIVEHPALDACRDGIRAELEGQGFPGLDFTYESAQGQPATAAQIARRLAGLRPDVIVPISTPSAQAVVAATKDIPVVFTAVTDPVAAGLVTDAGAPGGNVTGLSDLSPIGQQLDLVRALMPALARLGVVYNPGEANSVVLVDLVKVEGAKRGISIVEAAANRSADVQSAARSLVGKVEAIYVPTDNSVVAAFEALLGVMQAAKIPVFAGDTDTVQRGAIATVGFDYGQIGRQTGALVARVLRGESPGGIPVRQAEGTDIAVNLAAAALAGLGVPEAIRSRATKTF